MSITHRVPILAAVLTLVVFPLFGGHGQIIGHGVRQAARQQVRCILGQPISSSPSMLRLGLVGHLCTRVVVRRITGNP
jgi:hypothetical protein